MRRGNRLMTSMSMSAKRGVLYLDFDRTLFDVDAMMRPVKELLLACDGVDEASYEAAYRVAKRGGYSFERHLDGLGISDARRQQALSFFISRTQLGDMLLFPEVIPTILELRKDFELFLLTFGNEELQRRKFESCRSLVTAFSGTYYVHGAQTKGQILAKYGSRTGMSYFLDDSAFELQDVRKQAPEVGVVQIVRQGLPAKAGEVLRGNDWPIVPDLATFQAYLYESFES